MQALVKGQVKAIFCAIMAFILAFGLSVLPVPSYADEKSSISVNGVTFLQPSAQGWELLKVDNLGKDQSIYITVYKTEKTEDGKDGKPQPLGHPVKFSPSDNEIQGTGEQIAQLVALQIFKDADTKTASTAAQLFPIDDESLQPVAHPTYTVEVSSALKGKDGDLYKGTIYPVYAKLVDPSGQIPTEYTLLGVRTSDTKAEKMLGVGTTFYKQNTKSANTASIYALANKDIDNTFDKGLNAFVVTYNKAKEGAVEGKIRYVDLDGNLIKESEPIVIEDKAKATVEAFFTKAEENENGEKGKVTYYRTIFSSLNSVSEGDDDPDGMLARKVELSANNATYTVKAIPILADDVAYTVTINYTDDPNFAEKGKKPIWSDTVVVTGDSYSYTLPNVFSVNKRYRPDKKAGIDYYTLGEANMGSNTVSKDEENSGTVLTFTKNMVDGDFDIDAAGNRTVTAVYNSQDATGEVDFTLVLMDGQSGKPLDTIKQTITSLDEEPFVYKVEPTKFGDKTYVPWAGNPEDITYTWESLGKGVDLLQYVYYVPEDYVPANPYDITIQYMNIANSQVLRTETITVDPENNNYIEVVGDSRFTQDGNTYVRLAGQDTGIRHASLSPNRTYTIYYRDVNDTINANTIIDRIQIIETTIPGTGGGLTAAAGADAAGAPDAGVAAGDGTVVINDDNNPLANLDGQDTTTERIIEENENPLASGNVSQNPLAIAGIVAGVIALAGIIAYIFYRRRKKANDAQNA